MGLSLSVIPGNEEADKATAASETNISTAIRIEDQLLALKNHTRKRWAEIWENQDTLVLKCFPGISAIDWPGEFSRYDKKILLRPSK